MTDTTDGTEDVNDFLTRIRELGEQRDKEDSERTKKLEDEIIQGRKERQARRAERARSISPTKDSPLLDPARLSISSVGSRPIDPPEHLEPTTRTPDLDTSGKPDSPVSDYSLSRPESGHLGSPKANEYGMETSPTRPAPPALSRSRTGTLSWQQRPSSREFNRRSLFSPTSPTRTNRLRTMTRESQGQEYPDHTDLGSSNDTAHVPRPTTDRTVHSPTSKSTSDDPDTNLNSSSNQEAREANQENAVVPEKQSSQQNILDERSRSPSRASSTFGDSSLGNRYSSMSSVSTATGLGSPLPTSNAQRFEPRKAEQDSEEQLPPSPTQRRLSPERPSSQTKGLGGFVQSAMMKRSDTVSKRWSAQLPSGVSRSNSVASNRNSIAMPNNGDLSPSSAAKLAKDVPLSPSHRPGSSHSEATTIGHNRRGSERPSTPPVPGDSSYSKTEEVASGPSLSIHARSSSTVDKDDQSTDANPTSPLASRTMDPKRWSPTKASWLESALNRPDSPRHRKQPSHSQQASWSRDRQSKGSVDLGRKNSFKEVTPVGLMRSVPLGGHQKKPSLADAPDVLSILSANKAKESSASESVSPSKENAPAPVDTSTVEKEMPEKKEPQPEPEPEPEPRKEEPVKNETLPSPGKSPERKPTEDTSSPVSDNKKPSPLSITPTPNIAPSPLSARDPDSPKPKTQSPVIDFRANLRKRGVVKESGPKEEPEFKNVFGRLKKTETSNHTQPDELKNTILKGRAALNATGGPKKSSQPDNDLKEGLLKQKEVRTGAGLSRRSTETENDAPTKPMPEAIARRQNLTKSNSVKSSRSTGSPSSPFPREPSTPDFQPLKSPSPCRDEPSVEASETPQVSRVPEQPLAQGLEPQTAELTSPVIDEPSPEITKDEAMEEQQRKDELEAKRESSNGEATQPVRAMPSENVAAVGSAPAASEGPAAKGNKLAGRINPALAGLLSRAPAAPASDRPKGLSSDVPGQRGLASSGVAPGAPLTHMTKNRARGPKRRMPGTTAGQAETPASQPGPVVEPAITQPESSLRGLEDSIIQPELSVQDDESLAREPELSITQPAPPSPKDEPAAEPELPVSEPELSIGQTESFDPKAEAAAQPESPVSQHDAPASAQDPPTPNFEPLVDGNGTVSSMNKPIASQPEPYAPKAGPIEPHVDEPGISVMEPQPVAPKEEPSVVQPEKPVSQPEPALTQPEVPAPKKELPASEPITLCEEHASGLVPSEDEPPVVLPEPSKDEPSPVQPEELSVTELKAPAREVEPAIAASEIPPAEPLVSASKREPPAQIPATQRQLTPRTEPIIAPVQPPTPSKEDTPSLSDQSSTYDCSGLDTSPSSVDRSIGDSSSNWPLPDSQPMVIGSARSEQTPETPRSDSTNVNPKSKLSALSPKSLNYYEGVENVPDTPSRRPVVPPKSPRTPTSDQRWSPKVRDSSQTPSPSLRTSYKENSMSSPVGSPSQRSFVGFLRRKSLPSPPVPPKRSDTGFASSRSSSSLVPHADESMEFIASFFEAFPKTSDRVDIDPQLMLSSRADDLKIRTVKKQVMEITSDGKKQDLPLHQEYILYEGSMYLCVHTFESEVDGNARTEAHLWCGDDVPDNAINDGQNFSRKVAKENSCKLEVIQQCKEPARFIHALGGILITRRGFNSRSSLSALYMLCGRKHLGQMVFDEVDFSRHNLCSGFPYVISAPFGKLYLWKGQGSTAEEVGAARLIGMDLGLTGEFEEVTEGEEPESFFKIFSSHDSDEYMRSDYWKIKPNHEHFRCRLLRVDHALGQQTGFWIRRPGSASPVIRPNDTVQEVEPYCLKDVAAKGIYILDTYFELYVIVGDQASHRAAEFASAVVFAHEYGILAASLQDRPFIPKSYVSIGGLPASCRSAFRKFDYGAWKMPQVFPLNAAIDAIRT